MVLDTKTLGLLNPSSSVPSAYLRTANPEVLSLLVLENLLHIVPPFLFTLLSWCIFSGLRGNLFQHSMDSLRKFDHPPLPLPECGLFVRVLTSASFPVSPKEISLGC